MSFVVQGHLAAAYPALGIGDDLDPAAKLWARLRTPDPDPPRRTDAAILRRAAELVHAAGPDAPIGPMRFSAEHWGQYLARKGIAWPHLPSGALALDDDTFREMSRAYPAEVGPIRELRHMLGQLRLQELAVGRDGRNRCLLSPFGARTSRNQPSNSRFIFGPSTWLRSLIRPGQGLAVAYVDWSQQEFGIGAALSGDQAMMDAYRSGDPYLTFAKQAGAVPADATKQTHKAERDLFKVCALAVQGGMEAESLAQRIGKPAAYGRELLRLHRETYPTYWRWSDAVQDFAMLRGFLRTVFGWTVHVGPDANPRSLRNFPMQANGAEMLRLACCLATERGIRVCAPVHDALLVEGVADEIEAVVETTQAAMREASELVLPGFPLRTDAKTVRWPDRYADERGQRMWEAVWNIVRDVDTGESTRSAGAHLPGAPPHPPPLLFSLFLDMDHHAPDFGPLRPGCSPAAVFRGFDIAPEAKQATEAPARGVVSPRADPVDLAGDRGPATREGTGPGAGNLAGSRTTRQPEGQAVPGSARLGGEQVGCPPGAASPGTGRVSDGVTEARPCGGGDHFGGGCAECGGFLNDDRLCVAESQGHISAWHRRHKDYHCPFCQASTNGGPCHAGWWDVDGQT